MNRLKKKVKNYLWRKFKDEFYQYRIASTPMVQNINLTATRKQKKAVVCYITDSFLKDWDRLNMGRTQPFEILSIVKVFTELDYAVDVIGCNDVLAVPYLQDKKYDLIFGFGEAFYQLTELYPAATSILYMTENHPQFADKAEKERLDYFYERTGKRGKVVRSGNFYKMHHFTKKYDYIITMSEVEPFAGHPNVYSIAPSGLFNMEALPGQKNHQETRKHFLWFGSYGAIHKGLDILLDVFRNREDIFLHVAGYYEDDRRIVGLPKRANIIDYGYIDIYSDTFQKVVSQCSFLILPSCSEGCSTSVTTGMRHGLIPVVNRNAGFNVLGDLCIYLEDYKVQYVDAALSIISTMDPEQLFTKEKAVLDFGRKELTINAFEQRLRRILHENIFN